MPFFPIRNDITRMRTDAIVNAANRSLMGGGGVDGAIHAAAGPELDAECAGLRGCRTGEAKLTRGYRLPAKYVIHTVGPIYQDGLHGEEQLLRSCYRNSLRIAGEHGFESVAFPLISAGAYGYPEEEAIRIAEEEIAAFLKENDMTVYLVFYNRSAFRSGLSRFPELEALLDDAYVDAHRIPNRRDIYEEQDRIRFSSRRLPKQDEIFSCCELMPDEAALPKGLTVRPARKAKTAPSGAALPPELEKQLEQKDESFQQMLLRCIDERHMTDAECYRRSNIDRRLFSKIRSNVLYKPTKATAAAFAVGLRLSLSETEELLGKAGFSLNNSSYFDITLRFFISHGIYDIFRINGCLFEVDEPLLGTV